MASFILVSKTLQIFYIHTCMYVYFPGYQEGEINTEKVISLTTLLLTSSLSTIKTWDWSSGMVVARGKLKLSQVEPTSEVPADFLTTLVEKLPSILEWKSNTNKLRLNYSLVRCSGC